MPYSVEAKPITEAGQALLETGLGHGDYKGWVENNWHDTLTFVMDIESQAYAKAIADAKAGVAAEPMLPWPAEIDDILDRLEALPHVHDWADLNRGTALAGQVCLKCGGTRAIR